MIIGCLCVYNEDRHVIQALESVIAYVDEAIVVDGSWDGNSSGDQTLHVVEAYSKVHPVRIIEAKPWGGDEAKKRQEYVVGKNGDIYFVIDADEVLFCGMEWLRRIERDNYMRDERAFNVVIWNKGFPSVLHQRIYRHPFNYVNDFPIAKYTVPLVIEHLKYKKQGLLDRPVYGTS